MFSLTCRLINIYPGSWLLLFLSYEEHWYSTIRKDILALISTYSPTTTTTEPFSGEAIFQALSAIPLQSWESKAPQLDLCIRETLRSAQPHTAVRKNTGPELSIANYRIPSGTFVLYPFSDTLLNPAIYPNPLKWNPARHASNSKEDFIGWGGGKHVCKGQRLGTLTMKLVVAYTLMRFDLAAVDGKGDRAEPIPDWNDFLTCRPQGECSIKFSERTGWEE
jgi:cytochrome P450